MTKEISVLVTGASGRQGGAVARALLAGGHRVKALTRKPDSKTAKELNALGAKVVSADTLDDKALTKISQGIKTIFLIATEAELASETRYGIGLVDAARGAGVGHLIYSSLAGVDSAPESGYFSGKYVVEQHIKSLGVPYTILAPAFFMENLLNQECGGPVSRGTVSLPLPEGLRLPLVSIAHLADAVVEVVEETSDFLSQRIELVADRANGAELVAAISQAYGRRIAYREVSLEEMAERNESLARTFEWFRRAKLADDRPGLGDRFPRVRWQSFAEWAMDQEWSWLD